MKDENIKNIVEQSEVKTSYEFTDNLIAEIENGMQKNAQVAFWTLPKIAIGFVAVAILSGVLGSMLLPSSFTGATIIPIVWSFLLLIGLNHLLALHKCQSILEMNHKGMTPTKETLQL